MMKLNYVKASTLFAAITIALLMSCSEEEEKVTPRSSTSSIKEEKEIIIENDDYISEDNNNGSRITQNIKIRYITGYFARLSNATAGSVKLIIVKESTNTIVATSASKAVSALGIWSGNTNDVDYTVCTFGWTNGLSLDPNESYRIEAHCTDCSTDADKKVVWWSTNNYTSSSQDTYTLGTGKAKDGASWVSKNNDFSFKIQNVNSDGSFYVSRAQSTKQKVYDINTSVIRAQSFKPELGDDYIISFPDANLAATVRENVGLAVDAPITYSSVKNIKFISPPSVVSSLEGIQYLEGLQRLSIYYNGNFIANLTPLQGLTNLQSLQVKTSATDITPLSALTNLIALKLNASEVTNIDALRTLSKLESLILSGPKINNIDALTELTNVKRLSITANALTDVSPIENLSALAILYLESDSFTSVPKLSALTELTGITFVGDALQDISALNTPLPKLISLSIHDAKKLYDLDAISNQTQLKYLDVYKTSVSNVSGISNLVNLGSLWVLENQISDVTPFRNLSKLEGLYLGSNRIESVEVLSNLTALNILDLTNNPLTQEEVNALRLQLDFTDVIF